MKRLLPALIFPPLLVRLNAFFLRGIKFCVRNLARLVLCSGEIGQITRIVRISRIAKQATELLDKVLFLLGHARLPVRFLLWGTVLSVSPNILAMLIPDDDFFDLLEAYWTNLSL